MRARDVAELVRLPAALTVPGDSLAGAAHAGDRATAHAWALPAASAFLYWGGMALNDWADRGVDAVERPERPVPSGRISASTALAIGSALCASGVAVSAVAGGRRAVGISLPLAGLVVAYDAVAKPTPCGPLVMASTRGLDVLLGAAGRPTAAWEPATAVAAHTAAVTLLSRGEVHGTARASAQTATAVTAAVAMAGAVRALTDTASPRRDRLVSAALSGLYFATVTRAQAGTVVDPSAATVRAATGTGIRGLVLLQAAWLARRGRLVVVAGVLAAGPVLRAASRVVSPT